MSVVTLAFTEKLARIEREKMGRGFVYVLADRFGNAFVVSQNLKKAVDWVNGEGIEDPPMKPSAVYEACHGGAYRHRWRVLKLDIYEALPIIDKERQLKEYDQSVVVGSPSAYRVAAC